MNAQILERDLKRVITALRGWIMNGRKDGEVADDFHCPDSSSPLSRYLGVSTPRNEWEKKISTFQGPVGATVTAVEALDRVVDSLQELEASVDCVHREIAIFRRLQASFGSGFGSADQEVYIQSGVCSIKIIERT